MRVQDLEAKARVRFSERQFVTVLDSRTLVLWLKSSSTCSRVGFNVPPKLMARRQGQVLVNWSSSRGQGQGLSSRTTHWVTVKNGLLADIYQSYWSPTSVSKTFFTVSSCSVTVTEFMDVRWSYITDSLQNAKSLKIFKDFVVQGQGQGHGPRGSSRTRTFLEDYNTGLWMREQARW